MRKKRKSLVRRIRDVIMYALLPAGLVLIPLGVFSQSIFPGLGEGGDMFKWVIMFLMGAGFTVLWWSLRRWITIMDRMQGNLQTFDVNQKMSNQQLLTVSSELKRVIRRQNKHTDWIYKHNGCHERNSTPTNDYNP